MTTAIGLAIPAGVALGLGLWTLIAMIPRTRRVIGGLLPVQLHRLASRGGQLGTRPVLQVVTVRSDALDDAQQ